MNKHLKSAVERDKRTKPYLITPICEEDAGIIWELIVALGKVGQDDLKAILEDWKFLKDSDVLQSLIEWNLNAEQYDDNEGGENDEGRKFIRFEGELIELNLIKTVRRANNYNYSKQLMEWMIVLNKDFPDGSYLNSVSFKYPTEKQREKKLKELEQVLGKRIKIL